MTNIRIPRALCAVVAESLCGSHNVLDALFLSAGAPLPIPSLPHHTKWKTWIFQAGTDPNVDSLAFLGNLLEECMDLAPNTFDDDAYGQWEERRVRVDEALKHAGFQYFRGGRVIPLNQGAADEHARPGDDGLPIATVYPSSIGQLLTVMIRGLKRSMHPLTHRRRDAPCLTFDSEYDVQDLLHSMLRPWIADIRPEEFTPSYAGSSTRMDFLLPAHRIVIELKFVRDRAHGRKIGDELIVDIEH